MNEHEHCPFCKSEDTVLLGKDTDGYFVGWTCDEWHCNTCEAEFAANCVETDEAVTT